MAEVSIAYPISLSIDYPDRKLNRLTTFFRLFMVIPILIILGLLIGTGCSGGEEGWSYQYATVGFVFLPLMLMLLFRRKYPRWCGLTGIWLLWGLARVSMPISSS